MVFDRGYHGDDLHVGHCAHDAPVLQNRAAGHALHDAAGGGKQPGIGHLDHHAFGGGGHLPGGLGDFHRVFLDALAVDGGQDGGGPCFHRFLIADGQAVGVQGIHVGRVHFAENAQIGVFLNVAQNHLILEEAAPQLSRRALSPPPHIHDLRLHEGPHAHRQQVAGVRVVDGVAQAP